MVDNLSDGESGQPQVQQCHPALPGSHSDFGTLPFTGPARKLAHNCSYPQSHRDILREVRDSSRPAG